MSKVLSYVDPKELHDYWDLILPGLLKVKAKSSDGWIPEDVYCELRNGRSTLYIADIDDEYAGFIVASPRQNFDGMSLFVWCVYAHTKHDPIATFFNDLRQMARNIKAKKILFASKRNWERRLAKYGFAPETTTYSVEV